MREAQEHVRHGLAHALAVVELGGGAEQPDHARAVVGALRGLERLGDRVLVHPFKGHHVFISEQVGVIVCVDGSAECLRSVEPLSGYFERFIT